MPDILVHIDEYSIAQIKSHIGLKIMCEGRDCLSDPERAAGRIAVAAEEGQPEITIAFPQPVKWSSKKGKKSKKE